MLDLPVLLAATLTAQTPAFVDPGPPRVAKLADEKPTSPTEFEGLEFHGAPRPLAKAAASEDWPGFLGPRRNGRSRETRLLKRWPETEPKLVWSMPRGQGYAGPAVAAGKLVYQHRVGGRSLVDCVHAETGRRYWRFSRPTDYRDVWISDSGPRSTPQIDGDRTYVLNVDAWLHCLELATGRVIWQRNLKDEFDLPDLFFGVASSPLIYGELLILNLGAPGGPSVAAFDKRSGRLVWGTGTKWGMSCASPVVAKVHGRDRLFVLTGGKSRPSTGGLMVMDPVTGALDFEFPFRSRTHESVNGASPVIGGGRVFLTASYSTGTTALALEPDGGFEQLWAQRRFGIEFATPLFVDGHLYLNHGSRDRTGGIVCVDPVSGEHLDRTDFDWDETVPYQGTERELSFSIGQSSMIWADGTFYCLGDNGHLLALECTPEGSKVLARASLFRATESWTPLVLSRGLLYVCQNRREKFGDGKARLYCYDLRGT